MTMVLCELLHPYRKAIAFTDKQGPITHSVNVFNTIDLRGTLDITQEIKQ